MRLLKTMILVLLGLALTSCTRQPGDIDSERLAAADSEPGNWMSLGRSYMQQHHSPLDLIDKGNVKDLGFAWEYQTLSSRGKVNRGLEATPIVVDGVMFTSGSWSQVYAIDAKTGQEIWRYDPDADGEYARRACCDVVNRGVQVWKGRVYVGTLDGYLVCLDAGTGKEIWKQDTFIDRKAFYTITGPPQIANNVVVIGNSGAEFGVRGYITAYDLVTGNLAWRFFTVPSATKPSEDDKAMTAASQTWDPSSDWVAGGGGTVWGEMAYDPHLDLLYVGTGNSTPYPSWLRSPAGGDNLYLVSILAINPANGELVWHYQTTPAENWDFTCTANIVLADLTIDGTVRNVLMQAPKNGFFYVIDRKTGKLISAENYVPVNWASGIDLESGRPVLTEHGDYRNGRKYVFPGPAGGHNWHPMSYSPQTGLVYIPTLDLHFIYGPVPYKFRGGYDNTAAEMIPIDSHETLSGELALLSKPWPPPENEVLKAWDPVTQKEKWRVKQEGSYNGGLLSTDGNLVFQGTPGGKLVVYNADSGEKLKEIETGTGIMAAPVTYTIDGEQYVAVMAGYGGVLAFITDKYAAMTKYKNTGRILAFKLGGGAVPLPDPQDRKTAVPELPPIELKPELVSEGMMLYNTLCGACHFVFGERHYSEVPDLSIMSRETHDDFNNIVLDGKLAFYGMASFADVLSKDDAEKIHHYLLSVQKERFEKQATAARE